MGNCNKTKHMCGDKTYATCVYYETELPSFSALSEESCVTLEETTEDLYHLVRDIKDDLDLSDLGQECLTYVTGEERNTVKKVLLKYEEEICLLKERVLELETEAICNRSIIDCVDVSGIEDACDNPITSLGQLLQYLVNQTLIAQ